MKCNHPTFKILDTYILSEPVRLEDLGMEFQDIQEKQKCTTCGHIHLKDLTVATALESEEELETDELTD